MPTKPTSFIESGHRHNEALAICLENLVPGSIVIIGAGKSGQGAYDLLNHLGLQPLLIDDAKQPAVQRSMLTSEFLNKSMAHVKAAVLSPGVSLAHPVCQELLRTHVQIFSEVEVGLSFLNQNIRLIAVTGTNGKSTVTHSIAKLFQARGQKVQAIGNIGSAVSAYTLQCLKQNTPHPNTDDTLVVELSSYQLETMYFRGFDAAVFTNFSSDHLARYQNLENYFRAKWRLTKLLKTGAALALSEEVVHYALQFGASIEDHVKLTVVRDSDEQKNFHDQQGTCFDLNQIHPRYHAAAVAPSPYPRSYTEVHFTAVSASTFRFRLFKQSLDLGGPTRCKTEELTKVQLENSCLPGRHNAQNLSFCLFAEWAFFPGTPSVFETFFNSTKSEFAGLEHRLENVQIVGTGKKFLVVNDSKSTSFICTAQALACFQQNVHLILGGQLKDRNLSAAFEASPHFTDHKRIQKIYCIGPDAVWLAAESSKLTGAHTEAYATMQQAVRAALENIGENEVLLFSPGAASFDSFQNFEDRGIQFKLEVARLLNTELSSAKRS